MAAILKIENRPYLLNGLTDLCEIRHDDAYWASESDRKLKFTTYNGGLGLCPQRGPQLLKIQHGGRPLF